MHKARSRHYRLQWLSTKDNTLIVFLSAPIFFTVRGEVAKLLCVSVQMSCTQQLLFLYAINVTTVISISLPYLVLILSWLYQTWQLLYHSELEAALEG